MKVLVELFLKPLFGEMVDVVHIVTAKPPISFRGPAREPGYTNAAGVNDNSP